MNAPVPDSALPAAAQGASLVPTLALYAEDTAFLWVQRTHLTRAPHMTLALLERHDARLAAQLDGLAVGGHEAWLHFAPPGRPPRGASAFAVAVRALEEGRTGELDRLFERLPADVTAGRALHAALGWLSPSRLRGTVQAWLASPDAEHRHAAIAACALHRVDPGARLRELLGDTDPRVQARAVRAAGELGRSGAAGLALGLLSSPDERVRYWAAWTAVLRGDTGEALERLADFALQGATGSLRALLLCVQSGTPELAHDLLRRLRAAGHQRAVIVGAGVAGDLRYADWLLGQMESPETARLAGEAFQTMTGLDLFMGYDRPRPEGYESGPTPDPADDDVGLDPDEHLPWPDVVKLKAWWSRHRTAFAQGTRHFLGQAADADFCRQVLAGGYQRQRIAAAHYLCLRQPALPLFNTTAPAWRQRRLLLTGS